LGIGACAKHAVEVAALLLLDSALLNPRLLEAFAAGLIGLARRRALLPAGGIVIAFYLGLLGRSSSRIAGGAALARQRRPQQDQSGEVKSQSLHSFIDAGQTRAAFWPFGDGEIKLGLTGSAI
jgi:hypothetical protein